jgi:hypothetical protein
MEKTGVVGAIGGGKPVKWANKKSVERGVDEKRPTECP